MFDDQRRVHCFEWFFTPSTMRHAKIFKNREALQELEQKVETSVKSAGSLATGVISGCLSGSKSSADSSYSFSSSSSSSASSPTLKRTMRRKIYGTHADDLVDVVTEMHSCSLEEQRVLGSWMYSTLRKVLAEQCELQARIEYLETMQGGVVDTMHTLESGGVCLSITEAMGSPLGIGRPPQTSPEVPQPNAKDIVPASASARMSV